MEDLDSSTSADDTQDMDVSGQHLCMNNYFSKISICIYGYFSEFNVHVHQSHRESSSDSTEESAMGRSSQVRSGSRPR